MKKEDSVDDQLQGIIDTLGPHDYQQLVEHMNQLFLLDNPTDAYKDGIMKNFKGPWEDFVLLWRSFHIHSIAIRNWRKFKLISKRYPDFQKILKEIDVVINE